jgi:hypothetical protein
MTNEQVYDPQLALRQTIAGLLDRPSVYMGGPSRQNLKRADDIIAAIRGDARLVQALGAHEPSAPREPINDQDPCPMRPDGYHDFRHEVCDCGSYRNNTFPENRRGES